MRKHFANSAIVAATMAVLAGAAPTWSQGGSDLLVTGSGMSTTGEPMTVACELAFAAVPSNRFVGECRIGVGGDQLTLTGVPGDEMPVLTVVLNGGIAIRGGTGLATGRFEALAADAASGFPIDVEIDPLARTWAVRGHGPGPAGPVVATGSLAEGGATLALTRTD